MVEQSNYSELTPAQLNNEFKILLEHLPKLPIADTEVYQEDLRDFFIGVRHRLKSEHRDALMSRLDELISNTPGTRSLRKAVRVRFGNLYLSGSQSGMSDEEVNFLNVVSDKNSLESGGIFDESRVKELEMKALELVNNSFLLRKKIFDERSKRLGIPEEIRGAATEAAMKELEAWAEDYSQLYGERPSFASEF